MTTRSTIAPPADDPEPAARWRVIYRDTFDRECPPSADVEGVGVLPGLIELWARYLFESVTADGQAGFSDFTLAFDDGATRGIGIEGSREGARKLRAWVFGTVRSTTRGVLDEADVRVLGLVARAHARGRHTSGMGARLLELAAAARDVRDLEERLAVGVG